MVEMEPVRVSNPLRDLLTKSKEKHDRVGSSSSQHVLLDPSGSEWADDGISDVLESSVDRLCGDYNRDLKLQALQALEDLASAPNDENVKSKIVSLTGSLTGLLIVLADNTNPDLQARSARVIRHLARGGYDTKIKIVNHPGALNGLVNSFSNEANPSLRQESVWALSLLAAGDNDIKSKVAAKFVLNGLMTLLEDDTDPDLHSKAISAWRNLESGGSKTKSGMVLRVLEHDVLNLGRQRVLKELPPEGNCFQGLGACLLKLGTEEEVGEGREENQGNDRGGMEDGEQRGEGKQIGGLKDGKQWGKKEWKDGDDETGCLEDPKQWGDEDRRDDCIGCWSFYCQILCSGLTGLYAAWTNGKGAAIPQTGVDDAGDVVSPGERPKGDLTNHRLPLEAVLMSLSKDLEGKDLRQQRKILRDFCDVSQAPINAKTASYIAQHPEGLIHLVILFASPSLRGLAGLALKSLAANDKRIRVRIVGLLVSLISTTNLLQESAAWGLGCLAAGSDSIKAEIVSQLGTLKSLPVILREDANCRLQTMTSVILRNLAAGDCKIKTKICQLSGVLDWLVSSLNDGLNDLSSDEVPMFTRQVEEVITFKGSSSFRGCDDGSITKLLSHPEEEFARPVILSPTVQQNAALTLADLAGGDKETKARIVDYPRALVGLALALGKDEYPILQRNAAFALANLAAGDGQSNSKLVGYPGILDGLLLALRRYEYPLLQQYAAFALGCLACGDDLTRSKIVDHPGALEALVLSLTKNNNPALQKNVAWTLWILATSGNEIKSKIANHPGALEGLMLSSLDLDNIGMRRYLSLASENLSENSDVEIVEKTKICNDLWKTFSQPVSTGAKWTRPSRSYLHESQSREEQSCDRSFHTPEDYVKFGYTTIAEESVAAFFEYNECLRCEGWDVKIVESHLDTLLLSLPRDVDDFQNGPILQRQALRDLCDYVTSYSVALPQYCSRLRLHNRLVGVDKIFDYPSVLAGLGIVLSEDSNPHLQHNAALTLNILASQTSSTRIKIVDHPAVLAGLVTSLTKDASPRLQETTLKTLGLLTVYDSKLKVKVVNHPGIVPGLVKILSQDDLPTWQIDAFDILRNLAPSVAAFKVVEHLTSLLEPGNTIAFQYLAFSTLMHLAVSDGVATGAKIMDLHPWFLDSLLLASKSGHGLHFLESQVIGLDPRSIPASLLRDLAAGSVLRKIKLASYPGVMQELINALAKDKSTDLQERAVCALSRLAESDTEIRCKIVDHPGALAGLLSLLPNDDRVLRKTSALVLSYLAQSTIETKAKMVAHPGALAGLVMSMTKDESPVLQRRAAKALWLLADGDAETKATIVYHPGALEQLAKSLTGDENQKLQEYSAFALARLALVEEHRKRLKEMDALVECLQELLSKERTNLTKGLQPSLFGEVKLPSTKKWSAAAAALTLLDPVRGNATQLHTKDAYFGRGHANLSLGFNEKSLEDLNKADQLQQADVNEDLYQKLYREAIWRYRRIVKRKLGDFEGDLADAHEDHLTLTTPSETSLGLTFGPGLTFRQIFLEEQI